MNLTNQQAEGLAALVIGLGTGFTLLLIGLYVLLVIAYWKMFTKAGEAGWKSIIPLYNIYIAFKIAWKDGSAFWIYFVTTVICYVAYGIAATNAAGSSSGDVGAIIASVIALIAGIVSLVWNIRFLIRQARSYNKGIGCAILAIFFPNIMTLYYGFASTAIYQGPQD